MSTMIVCLCGCPKVAHKMGRKACGQCGTCDSFELDGEVPTPRFAKGGFIVGPGPAAVIPAVAKCPCGDFPAGDPSAAHSVRHTAWLSRDDAHPLVAAINAATATDPVPARERPFVMSAEQLRAELRRVEQERDEAIAETQQVAAELAEARTEQQRLDAELASARQELDRLRARVAHAEQAADPYPDPSCGKHTGRASNRCLLPPGHPYDCDDCPPVSRAAVVIFAFDAWQCLTPGGCGARYTRRTATNNHPCGPLTAVRVTITHREDPQ